MSRRKTLIVLLALCSQLGFVVQAAAPVDLGTAIMNAKILPKGQSVRTMINGNAATVSTYIPQTRNLNVVCQLNTLLIAKKVFDIDKSVAWVLVQFYFPPPDSSYIEYGVARDTIAGFDSGKLTKEQAFAAMKYEHGNGPTPGRVTNPSRAAHYSFAGSGRAATVRNYDTYSENDRYNRQSTTEYVKQRIEAIRESARANAQRDRIRRMEEYSSANSSRRAFDELRRTRSSGSGQSNVNNASRDPFDQLQKLRRDGE